MTFGDAYTGGDLSLRRDLTSLVTVVRERPRRPEAADHLVVRSILTWDPKQSPTKEVDFAEVRAALEQLPRRFPALRAIVIDAAAESSSVLPWARANAKLSLLVKPFTATADSNMQIWSALAARAHARSISIPRRNERLIAELRAMRTESFSFGSKYRVVDSSRQLHRDISFSLALAVYAAGEARTCRSPLCHDERCTGVPPQMLLFTPDATEWDRRHPRPEAIAAREAVEREVDAEIAAEREAEEGSMGTAAALRDLAAQGFSRLAQAMAARRAAKALRPRRSREERLAAYLNEQARAKERAEEIAAAQRSRADVEERVRAGGGAWFPGID